jgi:thiol:disulfide interchange protein
VSTTWNYETDVVTIAYNPDVVELDALTGVIKALDYGVVRVRTAEKVARAVVERVEIPKSAPADLLAAIERARPDNRLVIVDFWATWCIPCIKLKKTTLVDPGVKKLLEDAELVFVDLDQHPELGRAWGVATVPDILFLAPDGRVVDRLREYEDAEHFKKRLGLAMANVNSASSEKR